MSEQRTEKAKHPASDYWILFVCLLATCLLGVVMLSCAGLSAWGSSAMKKQAVSNATQTRQQYFANATATHNSYQIDRSNFGFVETFDDNTNDWETGSYDDQYFKGDVKVTEGSYKWNFDEIKQGFFSYGDLQTTPLYMTDFDIYVDGIADQATTSDFCYGLRFRSRWEYTKGGFYIYVVCDQGTYSIYYYDDHEENWLTLMDREKNEAIRSGEWNTIGVMARGSHFKFLINDYIVHELDDEHVDAGLIGLVVDVYGFQPGSISFDNFVAQGR